MNTHVTPKIGYYQVQAQPGQNVQVGRDKQCTCGGTAQRPCLHIQAVADYLRQGGCRAAPTPICPICNAQVEHLGPDFWRCPQDSGHYWQWRGERRNIAHRTTTGRRKKVLAGNVMVSGRPPYGYRLIKGDGTSSLVVREDEARIVGLIYQWYVYGEEPGKPLSIKEIARRLTAMRVPTKADHNELVHKEREFGKWFRSSVTHILANETYVGRWHYGKRKWVKQNGKRRQIQKPRSEWLCVSVPQLIDETTWKLAQRKREQNKRRRKQVHNYLLNRRVSCGKCGARMRGCPSHAKSKVYLYYRCPGTQGQRIKECDAPTFRADGEGAWDDVVWNWIAESFQDPARLGRDLKHQQANREKANRPLKNKLAAIDDLLVENTSQLERLLDLYLSGEFDKAILAERKARLETTIVNLESQRATVAEQIEAEAPTDEDIKTLVEYAEIISRGVEAASQDFERKQRIVEMLDLTAEFFVEDGEQVCYVDGFLGRKRLQRGDTTSKCMDCQYRDKPSRRYKSGGQGCSGAICGGRAA